MIVAPLLTASNMRLGVETLIIVTNQRPDVRSNLTIGSDVPDPFRTLLKNTSVAMTIGLLDLTAQAQQMNEFTFRTFESFSVVTLVYFALSLGIYWIATMISALYSPTAKLATNSVKGNAQ